MAVVATVSALTACGSLTGSGMECTAVGTPVGVGLEIEPPFAAKVASATMKICWDGVCHTPVIHLSPSTRAGRQSCAGDRPEDTCGVAAERTGGQHGFGAAPGLPKKPVEVTLVLRDSSGGRLLHRRLTVTPEGAFPNGPNCGEGGPQAGLVVADGQVRPRG
ncbi:hypothetical protein [Actinomadura sp. HBU206391]|uniref:hypothetical protein n=1 Tax=Actinomadura sp. HBU206391 TaxID=2731692 RepID=UPI00164F1155|nr:hypothetical protein [Actinomadura sp. HBU206391]MBC6459805.1 hypothetical protein [Actinomadura sp. HBU206391]